MSNQTPRVYQICFGRESDQNLKCTKTTTKMKNLFCNNAEYIWLFKFMIYMLLSVIFNLMIVCFGNKVVQRMYTGNTSAFVFGVSQSSHKSWQRQFKLDLILLGTMSCDQLTSIEQWHRSLFSQCIIATSQVSNHGLQAMFIWHYASGSWLCLHIKITK